MRFSTLIIRCSGTCSEHDVAQTRLPSPPVTSGAFNRCAMSSASFSDGFIYPRVLRGRLETDRKQSRHRAPGLLIQASSGSVTPNHPKVGPIGYADLDITLSDGEGRGERSPSRRSARWPCGVSRHTVPHANG